MKRDPEMVLRDVVDGIVTPSAARREYGVVVDVHRQSIDVEETKNLRLKVAKVHTKCNIR